MCWVCVYGRPQASNTPSVLLDAAFIFMQLECRGFRRLGGPKPSDLALLQPVRRENRAARMFAEIGLLAIGGYAS